ncbi:MAG: adenylate kinase [Ruminococcaceae bacterium]|nr:adenylate kinase [Oscillospiraceae bacterium]
MKKAIVIGCPGSGKTTFSLKLSKHTGLSLIHLDAIWHLPDKTHIPREEFDKRLEEFDLMDSWIIDGNYSRTVERRIQMSDTVFIFDLPVEICIDGAISRIGKERYDMPWIEKEIDPEFLKFIEEFPHTTLQKIYDLMDKYKDQKNFVVFKSRQEADQYIKDLEKTL